MDQITPATPDGTKIDLPVGMALSDVLRTAAGRVTGIGAAITFLVGEANFDRLYFYYSLPARGLNRLELTHPRHAVRVESRPELGDDDCYMQVTRPEEEGA